MFINLNASLQPRKNTRKLQKQKMGTKPIEKFYLHYTNQFNQLEPLTAIDIARGDARHRLQYPSYQC
ncbi:MAG: hypothetical protein CVU27_06525, partial [Betaproteobacteria bacterium HGW-Betaproteobacteria-20]